MAGEKEERKYKIAGKRFKGKRKIKFDLKIKIELKKDLTQRSYKFRRKRRKRGKHQTCRFMHLTFSPTMWRKVFNAWQIFVLTFYFINLGYNCSVIVLVI